MSTWALRRQILYVTIITIVVVTVTSIGGYLLFHKVPNCFDGVQNGDETGVDCGGHCLKICPAQAIAPIILWQRIFPANTDQGFWSVVAEVENPNATASVKSIGYLFKVYDDQGVPIGEKTGVAELPANSITPIFESYIPTGKHIPVRATFEFTTVPEWFKIGERLRDIEITNQDIEAVSSAPRVTANIQNLGLNTERDIEVIAIVYDAIGNAIAASRTSVDELQKNASQPLAFTWRIPFVRPVSRVEIVPKYDPYIAAGSDQ